jgi:hypothetical protein
LPWHCTLYMVLALLRRCLTGIIFAFRPSGPTFLFVDTTGESWVVEEENGLGEDLDLGGVACGPFGFGVSTSSYRQRFIQ